MKTYKEVAKELYCSEEFNRENGINRFHKMKELIGFDTRTPEDLSNLKEYLTLYICKLDHALCVVRDMLDKEVYHKEMVNIIERSIFIDSMFKTFKVK